jgi:hypothetical protein
MQEGGKDDEGRNREAEEPDRQDEDLKRPVKVGRGAQRREAGRARTASGKTSRKGARGSRSRAADALREG